MPVRPSVGLRSTMRIYCLARAQTQGLCYHRLCRLRWLATHTDVQRLWHGQSQALLEEPLVQWWWWEGAAGWALVLAQVEDEYLK